MILYKIRGLPVFMALFLNLALFTAPLLVCAFVKLLAPSAAVRAAMDRAMLWIHETCISINTRILWWKCPLVQESWPELRTDGWYVVISNHQSWVDIFVLQAMLNRRAPLIRCIVKKQLAFLPLIGQIAWAYDYPFLNRFPRKLMELRPELATRDKEILKAYCERYQASPASIISFAEGTRWSPAKAKRRGSPYHRLLAPKAGGVSLFLKAMGPRLLGVVDITIAIQRPDERFWGLTGGTLGETVVNARLIPQAELPCAGREDQVTDEEHLAATAAWLNGLWAEKERQLDEVARRRWGHRYAEPGDGPATPC